VEEEVDADEAVCYLRGVHMSPYKVRSRGGRTHKPTEARC
jgi:hypothetical protein